MCEWMNGFSDVAVVLLCLCLMLFTGFLVTRATKLLRLPNVSGYIIAGILLGPGVLHAIPDSFLNGISFVSDLALSFIAFGVGGYFTKEVFSQSKGNTLIITLFESLFAGLLVTLGMRYLFGMDLSFSLLLGAIATATAPASTMMTIHNTLCGVGDTASSYIAWYFGQFCRVQCGDGGCAGRGRRHVLRVGHLNPSAV